MDAANRHFDIFVIPNFRLFCDAEAAVAAEFREMNGEKLEAANRWALAAGMNAAVPAYHMAEVILNDQPSWPAWLPCNIDRIGVLRQIIEQRYCRMLRGDHPTNDLTLLGAVVDAYKHASLHDGRRPVTSNRATIVTATGYGELIYGEGNYGGVDQVIVRTNGGGSRALSSILQNVVDMWRLTLGRPLEPLGR